MIRITVAAAVGLAALSLLATPAEPCGLKMPGRSVKVRTAKSRSEQRVPIAVGPKAEATRTPIRARSGDGAPVGVGGGATREARPAVAERRRPAVARVEPKPAEPGAAKPAEPAEPPATEPTAVAAKEPAATAPTAVAAKEPAVKPATEVPASTTSDDGGATDGSDDGAGKGERAGGFTKRVFFRNASQELSDRAQAALERDAKWLQQNP